MSLYQKPGKESSEFALTVLSFVAAPFLIGGGGMMEQHWRFWPGVAFMAFGVLFPIVAVAFYAMSRAKVKAAAEMSKPPPSRSI